MGRLIDLDKVLKIPMSKRAKEKVLKLKSKPAIIYDCDGSFSDADRRECHTLSCIMLMAFRYAVDRHITQALYRPDEAEVILQNLDLMQDDFVRQMICGIHNEYRLFDLRKEQDGNGMPFMASPYYLQPMLDKLQDEYEKRGYTRIPLDDCW